MQVPSTLPLRTRLVLMALIAVIPALTVIGYSQAVERRSVRERTFSENRRIMLVAASQQAGVFEGVARLLSTLSEFPALRDAEPSTCRAILPNVLRGYPGYVNLFIAAVDGTIRCSAAPLEPLRVIPPDRPWFQRALSSRAAAVGDYQISRLTGKPAVIVAQPLIDASGNITNVIAAILGLDQLNRLAAAAKLPTGATLTLIDRRRTIVARYPDGERWLGKLLPAMIPVVGLDAAAPNDGGAVESPGVDGVRRLYLSAPVEGAVDTGLFVAMGIDARVAFAESNRNMRRELLLILLVTLATALIAAFGGEAFVLRPVQALVAAANRIAAGDFTARPQLARGAPGLAEVSVAVDAMAGSLENRERQLIEQNRINALLADVGGALNEPGPLWPPLQTCAYALMRHADAATVRIWTLNHRDRVLQLQASAGASAVSADEGAPIPIGESAIGRLPRAAVPLVVDDIAGGRDVPDREWALKEGLVTFVAYPLIVQHRVVGVMAAYARQRWSDSVKASFGSVADHLALGIERHHAEEARRLLASIVEASDDAVYSRTNEGILLTWNDSAERLYGYAADEVIGRSVALIIPPDRPQEFDDLLQRLRAGEHLKHYETMRRRKDGSLVAVSLTLSPIRNESGIVIGASTIARDITDRQAAERAVRDAEERMRFALETSGTGIWEADMQTGVSRWSATLERLHGLEPGTFSGTADAFTALIHPEDRGKVLEVMRHAMRNRTDANVEYRTTWPDGTDHWISSIGRISYDDDGTPRRAAGVSIDVTARHGLEEQLRQAQKMDAVGQLAGGIAHDFNNLLTAIQGHANFLAEDLPAGGPLREEAEEIVRTSQRAAALTQQLLAFSRKQVLTTRVLRLGDVVADLIPMLRRLIGETIDLRAVTTDRARVKADAVQLEQVLVNLVVNARDAMKGQGALTVETADVTLDAQSAGRFPPLRPGPHVVLTVRDTGCGMEEATRSHIFDPFFTTKPKGQGTGLGLSTVYGIVRQSGGTITVTSEIGRGATFTIHLPCTDEPLAETRKEHARTTRGTETILLVEDEESVRELVAKVLSRLGYSVHAVAQPGAAIDFSRNYRSDIHLLVSDVMLPDMNGAALASEIVAHHAETRVLLISGYTDGAFGPEGILTPDTPFLQKPFTAKTLAEKVRQALEIDRTPA